MTAVFSFGDTIVRTRNGDGIRHYSRLRHLILTVLNHQRAAVSSVRQQILIVVSELPWPGTPVARRRLQ